MQSSALGDGVGQRARPKPRLRGAAVQDRRLRRKSIHSPKPRRPPNAPTSSRCTWPLGN